MGINAATFSMRGNHLADAATRGINLPVTHSSSLVRGLAYSYFFPPWLKPRCQGRVRGFVGGDGNIAIATALLPSSCLYCSVNIRQFMEFHYLVFYACLRLRFLDVETTPGPRRPVSATCSIVCSNVWSLAVNLSDLTGASSQYDIQLCSETLVSDPTQKFIVVATSRMIGIHRSSVDLRRRPSSAFESFPIISNAGSVAFPMLARDSVL